MVKLAVSLVFVFLVMKLGVMILRGLARPAVLRRVSPLGDATMGIFALHYLVLLVGLDSGLLGEPVDSWQVLVGRFVAVSVVTTALVLALRRVPLVRVVL